MEKFKLILIITLFSMIIACNKDVVSTSTDKSTPIESQGIAENIVYNHMKTFSQCLSKAVYEQKEVRAFIKQEALKQIDNDYNIFFPISKDKYVGKKTFEEILKKYYDKGNFEKLLLTVPLLNIHLPEIGDTKVANLDIYDEELPVLFDNVIYINGEPLYTLKADEIPGFNVLVVTESSTIRKKQISTKMSSSLSLNNEYEYTSESFIPFQQYKTKSYVEYDPENPLFDGYNNYIDKKYLDPSLIDAYHKTKNDLRKTRFYFYHDRDNNAEQTLLPARYDGEDVLYRFTISGNKFATIIDTVESFNKEKPIFKDNDWTKKKHRSRDRNKILDRLLTDNTIDFKFIYEDFYGETKIRERSSEISAHPSKLFNIRINEGYRHKTGLRHTKYIYSIDKKETQSKWFYPFYTSDDVEFGNWDILKNPTSRKIKIVIPNPLNGVETTIIEKKEYEYIKEQDFNANLSFAWKKLGINANGEIRKEKKERKTTISKTIFINKDEEIATFELSYFRDYPIISENNDKVLLNSIENSGITLCILPMTTEFCKNKGNIKIYE